MLSFVVEEERVMLVMSADEDGGARDADVG